MAGPVYKLWMNRFTPAWYRLSPGEREAIEARIGDNIRQVGGRWFLGCDSAWANEQWMAWGIDEYPDIDAHRRTADVLRALNAGRYTHSFTVLGSRLPDSEAQTRTEGGAGRAVYVGFLMRWTEAWYALSAEEQEKLMARVTEAQQRPGGRSLLVCDCAWGNEGWQYFGVEEYADIDAVQRHTHLLQELNWYSYVDSLTLLGTRLDV